MAMEAQSRLAGLGPCQLSCSHSTIHPGLGPCQLSIQVWVFWSTSCNDKVHCGKPPRVAATTDGAVIKNQIIRLLQLLLMQENCWECLVQFWGIVKIGDKTYLTTCDHPFALCYRFGVLVPQLCEYRKHCLEYSIPVDEDEVQLTGPPGRVFRSGLPEHARDVRDYTIGEYPQRDYAVGRVRGYWALPVYHHPTQPLPSGVLEIVSPYAFNIPRHWVLEKLREVNLTTPRVRLAKASSCQDGDIAKINEELIRRHLGWIISTWATSGEILSSHDGDFIRKGQGVVGKAFSSKSACFCRDISQLSITEYPLVPTARHWRDSACFAVCLQCSCSNNCIYVLEFFLPTDKKHYGDPRTLLNSLMETLKERLGSSFKIASGQELGQKLTVQVIKVSPEDEFDSFEICSTTGIKSTPRLEEVQGGDGMMQLDFSSQQADAANGSMDGIHNQQNGSVESTPRLEEIQGGDEIMQLDFSSQQADTANGSMDRIHNQQNGSIGSTSRIEEVQGGDGMMQVGTANAYIIGVHAQQSGIVGSPPRPEHVHITYQELTAVQFSASNLAGVDVAHNSVNGNYEQQNGIVESSPRQEHAQNVENIAHGEPITEINVANPRRDGAPSCTLESELEITREVLEQISKMKLADAASFLGVSRSTLKRKRKKCGFIRWPPCKARRVDQAFAGQRVVQPSTENMEDSHRLDTTRLEDDRNMWVKAEYQGDIMKFRLPLSARKFNLEEEVAKRLKLSIGSFKIKYQDEENEWIWIACDEDLSTCMSTLSSLNRTTIKMLVT